MIKSRCKLRFIAYAYVHVDNRRSARAGQLFQAKTGPVAKLQFAILIASALAFDIDGRPVEGTHFADTLEKLCRILWTYGSTMDRTELGKKFIWFWYGMILVI